MLIKCPECQLMVSDKALSCPHCGYPMKPEAKRKRSPAKRKRLPNGFGQISYISGRNLRNPYRAMITVGTNEIGRPIVRPLKPKAYFKTYNEAYEALIEYHRNPYQVDQEITVKELYERWSGEYFKELSPSAIKTIKSAWNYCHPTYNLPVSEIRPRHIKECMTTEILVRNKPKTPSENVKSRIKSLFNQLLDYAVEYEIVDKNYSRSFNMLRRTANNTDNAHFAFSEDEMNLLWENITYPFADVILIQCYTGWRPGELSNLLLNNVDLNAGIMIGGTKTEAGTNREVPIHSKIYDLIERHVNYANSISSKYLLNVDGGDLHPYSRYRNYFNRAINTLKLDAKHRPHDGRKHFITQAKKYNMDEYAIKYIVGHRINDVTESVYTERSIDWLKQEIEKIK